MKRSRLTIHKKSCIGPDLKLEKKNNCRLQVNLVSNSEFLFLYLRYFKL